MKYTNCKRCESAIYLDRRGIWRHAGDDQIGCHLYTIAEPYPEGDKKRREVEK